MSQKIGSKSLSRRRFLKQVAIVAPGLIIGFQSCSLKPSIEPLKTFGYPQLSLPNQSAFTIDALITDLNYTGKESDFELSKKLLGQIENDFAQNKCAFANGWLLSRTEIVLSNLN